MMSRRLSRLGLAGLAAVGTLVLSGCETMEMGSTLNSVQTLGTSFAASKQYDAEFYAQRGEYGKAAEAAKSAQDLNRGLALNAPVATMWSHSDSIDEQRRQGELTRKAIRESQQSTAKKNEDNENWTDSNGVIHYRGYTLEPTTRAPLAKGYTLRPAFILLNDEENEIKGMIYQNTLSQDKNLGCEIRYSRDMIGKQLNLAIFDENGDSAVPLKRSRLTEAGVSSGVICFYPRNSLRPGSYCFMSSVGEGTALEGKIWFQITDK